MLRRRSRPTVALAVLAAAVVAVAACSSSASSGTKTTPTTAAPVKVEPSGTGACDATDPGACLLPFPSDAYTRADPATPTGRRVDIPATGAPANNRGKHINPTEWNRNDGFSPSSVGLTVVPNLDVAASKLPPQTDVAQSLAPDSPLVVVDADTGRRIPAWAEVDPRVTDPARRLLRIVPVVGLPEGHRIAIALRDLRHDDGSTVAPSAAFARLVAAPNAAQRAWLDALDRAGAPASRLTIAWSFTVASRDGLSGRLRHMWQETRAALGANGAPSFTVASVQDSGAARVVRGTFTMPKYLTGDGGPGAVFDNGSDPNGIPRRNGTMDDAYVCTVPKDAKAASAPFVLYGHGLLGSRDEALGIGGVAATAGIGFCAVDELGMSSADVPTVIKELGDLTLFRTQADRMQQGALGFLELGRLLASPRGFGSNRAFQDDSGASLIDAQKLALLGASQGGILGGVPSAITNDWKRVILAVGGMGYNLLLRRSVDFDEFAAVLDKTYPDPLDQAIDLELMEQLWDRGENTAYAEHLTADPYPATTAKTVMLLEAFGDHQVANVATEKLARTLRVPRRAPTLAAGRSTDVAPFYGIDPIASFPHRGSGLVVWDFGTPAPPASETPNRAGDDPHGKLADVPQALALVASFVNDGTIIDVCSGGPCRTP